MTVAVFNLFINDFFYDIQHSQVCSFADDNTIHACGRNLDFVASFLCLANEMVPWFTDCLVFVCFCLFVEVIFKRIVNAVRS